MKTLTITLGISMLFLVRAFAQTPVTTFYKDAALKHPVEEKKAVYKQTVTVLSDASVLTEVRKIKDNTLYSLYRNEEPMGVWIQGKNTLNYDFNVNYTDTLCSARKPLLTTKDNRKLKKVFSKNISYPSMAEKKGMEGRVNASFVITASGKLENIAIKQSAHIALDKEYCRVLQLVTVEPVLVNGVAQATCANQFFVFKSP